ncbi:hypothetical protein Ciccas_000818 [Cichlidogyrus casuarinus]|uniref:B box-type domain-containing protein n=1 Tax=Cichlidogyrus casuarinus TaxID=1844966 RepID=A0ABD2QLT2_9PLAT
MVKLLPCLHAICGSCLTSHSDCISCDICHVSIEKTYTQIAKSAISRKAVDQVENQWPSKDLIVPNVFVSGLHELALCLVQHTEHTCDYCKYDGKNRVASYRAGVNVEKLRQAPSSCCDECPVLEETVKRVATAFCEQCGKLLCSVCRTGLGPAGENHLNHQCVSLELAVAETKARMDRLHNEGMEKEKRIHEQLNDVVAYLMELETRTHEAENKLDQRVQKLHLLLDSVAAEMREEILQARDQQQQDAHTNLLKITSRLVHTQSFGCYTEALLQHSRTDELLKSENPLTAFYNQIYDTEPELIKPSELASIDFLAVDENFDQLALFSHFRSMIGKQELKQSIEQTISIDEEKSTEAKMYSNSDDDLQIMEGQNGDPGNACSDRQFYPELNARSDYTSNYERPTRTCTTVTPILQAEFVATCPTDSRDVWPTGLDLLSDTGDILILDRDHACVKGQFKGSFGQGCAATQSPNMLRSPIFSDRSSCSSASLSDEASFTCLKSPFDLTVCFPRGRVFITDYQLEQILEFTLEGFFVSPFGERSNKRSAHLRGISSLGANLLAVVESRNPCVSVYDVRISSQKTVAKLANDTMSTNDMMMVEPYYIDFVPMASDIGIIISDTSAPCLKMFSLSMAKCLHTIASYGCKDNQVLHPQGVAWSATYGKGYLADHSNHRVQQFTWKEDKLTQLHCVLDKQKDDLWHPIVVKVDEERQSLIIAEALGHVKRFSL